MNDLRCGVFRDEEHHGTIVALCRSRSPGTKTPAECMYEMLFHPHLDPKAWAAQNAFEYSRLRQFLVAMPLTPRLRLPAQ